MRKPSLPTVMSLVALAAVVAVSAALAATWRGTVTDPADGSVASQDIVRVQASFNSTRGSAEVRVRFRGPLNTRLDDEAGAFLQVWFRPNAKCQGGGADLRFHTLTDIDSRDVGVFQRDLPGGSSEARRSMTRGNREMVMYFRHAGALKGLTMRCVFAWTRTYANEPKRVFDRLNRKLVLK